MNSRNPVLVEMVVDNFTQNTTVKKMTESLTWKWIALAAMAAAIAARAEKNHSCAKRRQIH